MKKIKSKKELTIKMPKLKQYYEFVSSVPGWQASVDGNISSFKPAIIDMVAKSCVVDITMSSNTKIFWVRTGNDPGFQLCFRCEPYPELDSVFLMDNISSEYGEVAIGYCTTSKNTKILIQIRNMNYLLIFGCKAKWSLELLEAYLIGKLNIMLKTFLGSDSLFLFKTKDLIRNLNFDRSNQIDKEVWQA